MSLPPEVLALLGDDATPEDAARGFDAAVETGADIASCAADNARNTGEFEWTDRAKAEAWGVWSDALAAAAIRECETGRAFTAALKLPKEQCEVASDAEVKHREAMDAYDALRNWRKP